MTAAIVAAVVVIAVATFAFVLRDSRSDADLIADVPDKVLAHDYVHLSMRTSLTYADGTVRYTDSSASLDSVHDRAHVDLPDVVRSGSLELVSRGLALYIMIPSDLRAGFGEKRWFRIDTASRAEARGARVGPVPDPITVLRSLSGSTGAVSGRGTRRAITVRPRLMAARGTRDDVASANRLGGLSLRWRATVTTGSGGELRRLELASPIKQSGERGTLHFDLRVGPLDEPIRIGIPPADAVETVPSVHAALVLLDAE
ncbi:MAG TPA: hypothetical protein VMZ22_14230 [Acidimicrobiales bacterium]|nr:hypothetical protein [Acidimicrobiales bacterium]